MGVIKGKHLGPMNLMPPHEGTCPECATDHDPKLPHNQQSLFYQYKFYNDHGKWPSWEDAMAHCSDEMKAFWRSELKKLGVECL